MWSGGIRANTVLLSKGQVFFFKQSMSPKLQLIRAVNWIERGSDTGQLSAMVFLCF